MNIELNFPPKLRGARSRLYRRRFLQVNTSTKQCILIGIGIRFEKEIEKKGHGKRLKALDEIYQIDLHSFAPVESNLKNHENRFCEASSGRKTMHQRRNNQTTAAAQRSLEEKLNKCRWHSALSERVRTAQNGKKSLRCWALCPGCANVNSTNSPLRLKKSANFRREFDD